MSFPSRWLLTIIFLNAAATSLLAQEPATKTIDEIHREYVTSLSQHQLALMRSAERALEAQQFQTVAIAIAVGVMVVAGLLLSFLQFWLDAKTDRRSITIIKAGNGGVEITSSVIGLIIIAISFWFFQAYINKVYAIESIHVPALDASYFVDIAETIRGSGEGIIENTQVVEECTTVTGEIVECN